VKEPTSSPSSGYSNLITGAAAAYLESLHYAQAEIMGHARDLFEQAYATGSRPDFLNFLNRPVEEDLAHLTRLADLEPHEINFATVFAIQDFLTEVAHEELALLDYPGLLRRVYLDSAEYAGIKYEELESTLFPSLYETLLGEGRLPTTPSLT
jgi:hypothetical protein